MTEHFLPIKSGATTLSEYADSWVLDLPEDLA
jgi:hypothetical protein